MRRLSLVVVCCALAGCESSSGPAPAPVAVTQPPVVATPDSIRWVQQSAEFQAALYQVYALATAHVERAAATRTAGRWAVVLDADETIISNATYQLERARAGLGYSPESWNAWVKRRAATPLPGAAAFLNRVRALGGRIAIVTNRLAAECDDTAAVFETHRLVYDAMLCRTGPSDKNPRFAAVAAGTTAAGSGPLDVLAFVGDNIQDFPALSQALRREPPASFADFGVRYFVVPNPMYGGWQ